MAAEPNNDLRPPAQASTGRWKGWGMLVLLGLVLGVAALWWLRRPQPAAAPPVAAEPAPAVALPASAPASAAAILYPVATAASAAPAASAAASAAPAWDPVAALTPLLGSKAVLSLLQTDQFAQRLVATVDNLGRSQAPSALWPVNPTPGRFQVLEQAGQTTVNPDNGLRYTPLVLLAESLPVQRSVAWYVQFYPQLQQAYQDLGFPQGYFNDRLVEVIDQLLATPAAQPNTALQLTEVKGPIASTRPWVRYEFVDPQLEALSAGQKMLLRVGPVNERRLKAKLAEFRRALVKLDKASP
jgi:hypothetical protein